MKYIFIVNGSPDKAGILPDLRAQLSTLDLDYVIYVTRRVGDGSLYVRMYCEFYPDEDCCFVACGGSGTANEVASALIARNSRKPMAILACGTSNDFVKCFPGRSFTSVQAILEGSPKVMDAIKCNDSYAINTLNLGFDADVVYEANLNIEERIDHPYERGVVSALFHGRFHRFRVEVDGRKISRLLTMSCTIGNGQYCGGIFRCTPDARPDDGLLSVCLVHSMTLTSFLLLLPSFRKGTHPRNPLFRIHGRYCSGRHITVSSGDSLSYVSLDGELDVGTRFDIEVLEKAFTLILPPLKDNA